MRILNLKDVVFNLESANYPFLVKIKDNKNNTFYIIAESENWHCQPDDEFYDWCVCVNNNGTEEIAFIDAYFGNITLEKKIK